MTMGAINAALKQYCWAEADRQQIFYFYLKVNRYNIIMLVLVLSIFLYYFGVVLHTLYHYYVTAKLCKCKFLGTYQECFGVIILDKFNTP